MNLRSPCNLLLALCVTPSLAVAQLSGTYTIDPSGTGPLNFVDFSSATAALAVQGVNGPVVLEVAPGIYGEQWKITPIPGATAVNTVTFKSPVSLAARLSSGPTAGDIITIDDFTDANPVRWVILDGFEFFVGRGKRAIFATGSCTDMDIRNCYFKWTTLFVNGQTRAFRWRIHHNVFRSPPPSPFEVAGTLITLEGVEGVDVHHNEVAMHLAGGIVLTSSAGASARSRIYNNVMYGSLSGTAVDVSSAINVDIDNNTILINTNSDGGACVAASRVFERESVIRNNILINLHRGPVLRVHTFRPYFSFSDFNIYWTINAPELIDYLTTSFQGWPDLSSWQAVTTMDQNSIQADPAFEDAAKLPEGLKLRRESPAIGMATDLAPWVTDDFEGTPRLPKASVGAFEGMPRIKFRTFGVGCAGSGGLVPAIGSAGLRRWGSADFAVTLDNALGGSGVMANLVIGTSNSMWSGISLPFDLGSGCSLLVSPEAIFGVAVGGGSGPGAGTANFNIPVPVDPSLEDMTIYFQWGVMDPAGGANGLAVSNGASLKL